MLKWCLWRELHSHCAGFETAVSAVGLHRLEVSAPGEDRTHTDAGFKPTASALGYGSVEMVSPAGIAPATC